MTVTKTAKKRYIIGAGLLVLLISAGIAFLTSTNMTTSNTLDQAKSLQDSPSVSKPVDLERFKNYQKPDPSELEDDLSSIQYTVTQEDGTETPFENKYWDLKEEGIYVDIVSGEPLFSSREKYVSGTGWPSFTKPISAEFVTVKEDSTLGITRIEARSKYADSHLGHIFNDGPVTVEQSGGADPTGLRYCMNSAALRFIPKSDLEKKGLGEYLSYL